MLSISLWTRRLLEDPRVRLALILILALVALALTLHIIVMADHTPTMLGTCLAVIVALVLVLANSIASWPPAVRPARIRALVPAAVLPLQAGRHPPDEGTVLLD